MYLTAQRVRNHLGQEELHAYLHLHGAGAEAMNDPLSVPQYNPGRLVEESPRTIRTGGNSVISYLDIIADDAIGATAQTDDAIMPQPWWQESLESVGNALRAEPLPWVVTVTGIHVIFSAIPALPVDAEYAILLGSAVNLWRNWLARSTAPST